MLSEKISPMNSSAPILPKRRMAVCFGLPRAVSGCTCLRDMNEVCTLSPVVWSSTYNCQISVLVFIPETTRDSQFMRDHLK